MSESVWLLIVSLAAMVSGVAVGSWLRDRLPEYHLNDQAISVIKSGGIALNTGSSHSWSADLDGKDFL